MIEIYLPDKPLPILIDIQDYPVFTERNWNYYKPHNILCANIYGTTTVFARKILGLQGTAENVVDHINGNRLDNRRSNLRICSNRDNLRNKKKNKGKYSSKYKGVSFIKSRNWWTAVIYAETGKNPKYLGRFSTQEEAALAYNEAALLYFGEFARLNLIEGEAK